MKNIDADYYGYMDDDDGLLIPSEEKCEREAIRKNLEQWKNNDANHIDDDQAYALSGMNVCYLAKFCQQKDTFKSLRSFALVDCSYVEFDETRRVRERYILMRTVLN